MPLPRLRLDRAVDPSESITLLRGASRVLWLQGQAPPPRLQQVYLALQGRLLEPGVRAVPTPGPSPGRNPWALRQDRQRPLRWGPSEGLDGLHTLAEWMAQEGIDSLDAVVFAGLCADLADQPLRALLRQLAPCLSADAPFLLMEPNGRNARRVARSLLASPDHRGEGRGTARTVEELRRLLETGGLGLTSAGAVGGSRKRDRLARRVLGADASAEWLLVTGRAIRGGEDLR
ncbi:MAG: hypothetical protein KDA24_05335 [Deltaproteobacteria bacterium]|nr:hypothetical protein [Deltaproteobacteria bacterium]